MKLFYLIAGLICATLSLLSVFADMYDKATYWTVLAFYSRYLADVEVDK